MTQNILSSLRCYNQLWLYFKTESLYLVSGTGWYFTVSCTAHYFYIFTTSSTSYCCMSFVKFIVHNVFIDFVIRKDLVQTHSSRTSQATCWLHKYFEMGTHPLIICLAKAEVECWSSLEELFIYGDIHYITNSFCTNFLKIATPYSWLCIAFL